MKQLKHGHYYECDGAVFMYSDRIGYLTCIKGNDKFNVGDNWTPFDDCFEVHVKIEYVEHEPEVGDVYEAQTTGARYIAAGVDKPTALVNMDTGVIWAEESLFGGDDTMLKYIGHIKDLK